MRRPVAGASLALLVVVAACGHPGAKAPPAASAAPEVVTKTTDGGPIKATVTLAPAKPRLGDSLTLTLTVDAQAGVSVLMPAFGEALGRFAIAEFVPGAAQPLADGGTRSVQRYTLESPLSGRHRIPALRIEFTDERPGHDAGGARELLTEEIPVEIASVLGDQGPRELRPPRGALSEEAVRGPRLWPVFVAAPILIGILLLAVRALRRRAAERARVNAFDVAMGRLAELAARLPGPTDADAWYVELSAIVRRYIEDRFAIRAPELTSEEFLHVARRSPELGEVHATLLGQFLAGCDRVKFAAYTPADQESAATVASARRFLDETRIETPAPATRTAA